MGSLLEFRDLGEVAQTLRACFLLPKMATVVEATSFRFPWSLRYTEVGKEERVREWQDWSKRGRVCVRVKDGEMKIEERPNFCGH